MRTKSLHMLLIASYPLILSFGRIILMDGDMKNRLDQFTLSITLDLLFVSLVLGICILLNEVNRFISPILIIAVSLLHLVNIEYIYAMDNVLNLKQAYYIGDKEFLMGSLSSFNFPLYDFLVLVSSVGTAYAVPKIKLKKMGNISKILGNALLASILILLTPNDANWKQGNFVHLTLSHTYDGFFIGNQLNLTDENINKEEFDRFFRSSSIKHGKSIVTGIETNRKKNVLLVVLEGMPGVYLEEVAKQTGIDSNVKLKSFEKIKDHSLIVPNFIAHNIQTIRGLYSILSGNYSKFDGSTPKAYEYLQLSNTTREKMLPKLLREQGYQAFYLQAAPLEFMSKDQFMLSAGFNSVQGEESFRYRYLPFGWGIDDKAFFEQAAEYIENVEARSQQPWFITLLTVGTHHPYAVPKEFEKQYPDRKQAAVAALDQALSGFIDYIQRSKLGEDTLVIFTSDESHGVDNQPYGSNTGFFVAYSLDIKSSTINKGVFGQIDILPTILDYLGLADSVKGRSVFREYGEDRPILFGNHLVGELYYSEKKGNVLKVDASGNLSEIVSSNGEVFSKDYSVKGLNNEKLKQRLLSFRSTSDRELQNNRELANYKIIPKKIFTLYSNVRKTITSGQTILIPESSLVKVSFEFELKGQSLPESIKFFLEKSAKDVVDEEIRTKVLPGTKNKGRLEYTFYSPNQLEDFSYIVSLIAFNKNNNEKHEVEISNLEISYKKVKDKHLEPEGDFKVYKRKNIYHNLVPIMNLGDIGAYPLNDDEIEVYPINDNRQVIYGPYINLLKGSYVGFYEVSLADGGLQDQTSLWVLDVTTNSGKILAQKTIHKEDLKRNGGHYLAELPFIIAEDDESLIEFRLREAKIPFRVNNISIKVAD